MDESGMTALHYACVKGNSSAIRALICAGANTCIPLKMKYGDILPIHIAAERLNHVSLSMLLSSRTDPNELDSRGQTPMYLAATKGMGSFMDLSKGLSALKVWGDNLMPPPPLVTSSNTQKGQEELLLPVVTVKWKFSALGPVVSYLGYKYPLPNNHLSLGASHSYPLHITMIVLRLKIRNMTTTPNTNNETNNNNNSFEAKLKREDQLKCSRKKRLGFE